MPDDDQEESDRRRAVLLRPDQWHLVQDCLTYVRERAAAAESLGGSPIDAFCRRQLRECVDRIRVEISVQAMTAEEVEGGAP